MTSETKAIIRQQIEEALLRYEEWKRGRNVSVMFWPYLAILDEIDAVCAYVSPKRTYRSQAEHKALMMFLGGVRVPDIVREMYKQGIDGQEVRAWIYGNEEKDGLVSTMYVEFMKLSKYCPFCDSAAMKSGQNKGGSYPLTGKSCPHRELEIMEED